jgi:nucleoside 2-deoxyribosyltransferase
MRNAVLALIETLKTKCGCSSVFYAGTNILSKDNFEPNAVALQDDLEAMRKRKNFIMYYPKRIASSVLYEAGWALMLGKPSIYIIGDRDNESLPFLLNDAGQAFEDRRVRIFKCPNRESMPKHVAQYGNKLFRSGD